MAYNTKMQTRRKKMRQRGQSGVDKSVFIHLTM